MPSGYSGELSQRQCGIQLSRINLGETRVLKNAFSRISREPKIPNFGNHGTTSKYTGFITNLPFWATRRLERIKKNKGNQKKNKTKSNWNWPRVLLLDLAHKQCNGIIKGWLHCLTSELKGRFLVNNMLLLGSAWCLVMVEIQFSLIKIGRPEHSLTPPPPTSDNISFLHYPPPPR